MKTIFTQIKFLKKYSKLSKYSLAVCVFGLVSVSLLSSPISPVTAATTIGVSNSTIFPEGLVGYWTFDGKNMSNATTTDISGYGVNGTLKNMTTAGSAIPGKMSQALKFNGTSNYINLGTSAVDISIYSISLWVYNYGSSTGQVFMRGNGYSYCAYNPSFSMGGGTISVKESGCGNGGQIGVKALSKGWHHVVVTRSGQNAIFYVDGVVIATDNSNNGANPAENILMFGAAPTNPSGSTVTNYFDGALDDVRIYNRAITPTEVQTLYKAGGGAVSSSVPSKVVSNVGINSDLMGYWTFDRASVSSTTVLDMSRNSTNGSLSGLSQSSLEPGRVGQAINFNGTSSSINLGNSASVDITGLITVSAWIKPRTNSGTQYVITKFAGGSFNQYLMYVDSAGTTASFCTGNCNAANTATASILANKWNHVVGVYDGTNTKIYVNSLFVGNAVTPLAPNLSGTNLYFGSNNGSSRYNGLLDDVRIYNRALSISEIKSLYKLNQAIAAITIENNNATGINSGLLGYWNFDGKYMTNATATDASGNGNNGTLTNMTTRANAVIGKIGQALNFNGATRYIAAGDILDFNYTDARTISAWVKPTTLQSTVNLTNTIISKQRNGSPYDGWSLVLTESGKVRFEYIQNLSSLYRTITTSAIAPINKWTHVVYVYNNNSGMAYVNGVFAASSNIGNTLAGSINNSVPLNIGNRDSHSVVNVEFDGLIDEVRVYDYALAASEIQALYKLGGR